MAFYSANGGGLTQEEHDWLESLASYTPNMYDINPTKQQNCFISVAGTTAYKTSNRRALVVCGYDVISFYKYATTVQYAKFVWEYNDGTLSEEVDFMASSYPIGWHDFKIPENAVAIKCFGPVSAAMGDSGYGATQFALFTKDSPYNPLNQS